jgi:peptidoglycan hydrolase-like protein with peptidoglycan-binding domain
VVASTAPAPTDSSTGRGRRPRRRWLAGLALLIAALAIAGGVIAATKPFSSGSGGGNGVDSGAPTGRATVQERSLTSQTQVSGAITYTGSYAILGAEAMGIYTSLPPAGSVIAPGQPLYWVDNLPVLLLYGHTPVYRALKQGMTGPDVKELNTNLVALGYATSADLQDADGYISDYFGGETKYALEQLQTHFGLKANGVLSSSEAVFEPGAMRLTTVNAALGAHAMPGAPFAQATSTHREAIVQVPAGQQGGIHVGDHVAITLPDNSVTPGVVTSIGTVASSSSNGGGGGGGSPTVNVDARPLHPTATGHLDQEPVNVAITTASVRHALVVPVSALLALASGGYAVEVNSARGTRQLLAVNLGLFDDQDGLVQVSGAGLAAGQQVVVPSST